MKRDVSTSLIVIVIQDINITKHMNSLHTHLDRLRRFLQSLLMQGIRVPTNAKPFNEIARSERFSTRTACFDDFTGRWMHLS